MKVESIGMLKRKPTVCKFRLRSIHFSKPQKWILSGFKTFFWFYISGFMVFMVSSLKQFFLLSFFPHSFTPSLFESLLMSYCSLSRKNSSKTLVSKLWFPICATSKPHFTSLSSSPFYSSSSSKPSAYSEGKFRSNAQKLIAKVDVIEVNR